MRVLAVVCISYAVAVFACVYLLPLKVLGWLAAGIAAACLLFLLPMLKKYRRLLLALLPFAFGLVFFTVYSQHTAGLASVLEGTEGEVIARLTQDPVCYDGYARTECVIAQGSGQGLHALLYVNDDETGSNGLADCKAGDRVSLPAQYASAGIKYGEEYDNYYAKGIFLILRAKSGILIRDKASGISVFPQSVRRAILMLTDRLFPETAIPLMKSILLGEKTDLYRDLSLSYAMRRAGFMHFVAVSGMHLSYLAVMVRLFIKRRRLSTAVSILVAWSYALVCGSGPAVVRAAFMLTVCLAAPLFRREEDAITSLSLALAVLLLQNPYAAAGASLQLSFGAMAGLLLVTPAIEPKLRIEGKLRGLWQYFSGTVSATLGVLVFTLPLTAMHFRSFSVISPLSCLAVSWLIPVVFCGGFITIITGALFVPAGKIAGILAGFAARTVVRVAELAAKVPYAMIYFENPVMWLWLLLVYTLIAIAVFSGLKKFAKVCLPLGLSACALAAVLTTTGFQYSNGDAYFAVLDVGQGQSLCAMQGDSTVIVDCGSTFTLTNAGEKTGSYLQARGRQTVDYLILTHLHRDHANGVLNLFRYVTVNNLVIPADADDADGLLAPILEACRERCIPVIMVSEDMRLDCGGWSLDLYAPESYGSINERCVCLRLSAGEFDALVTGDLPKRMEQKLVNERLLSGTEILIAGHHGSAGSSTGNLLAALGGNTAIISCGYNNYGHPNFETLARLEAYGYNIYRTDLHGDVVIKIPYQEVLNGKEG